MKKRYAFGGSLAVCVAVAFLMIVAQKHVSADLPRDSFTADEPTREAKSVVLQYIDAEKSGDVDREMNLSWDMKFGEAKMEWRQNLTGQANHNKITDVKIDNIRTVNNFLVMVTLDTYSNDGTHQLNSLPVYKENGKWKMVVGENYSVPMKAESDCHK